MLQYKTGDLVVVIENTPSVNLVGWHKDQYNRFILESFDSKEMVGVFMHYELTNNQNTNWYSVMIRDRTFLFTEKQIVGYDEHNKSNRPKSRKKKNGL
jgi:hypothetical protein